MAQRLSRSQELAVNDPAAVHDLILFTLRVEETVSPSVGSR